MSDDETVLIAPKAYRKTGSETTRKYHTRNCRMVSDNHREVSVAEVKRRGFEECRFCDPDTEIQHTQPNRRRSLRWAIANDEVSL